MLAISSCLCLRTVHALLRQGEGPLPRQGEGREGRKRLGQQPSHVTLGSARYIAVNTEDLAPQPVLEMFKLGNRQLTSPNTTRDGCAERVVSALDGLRNYTAFIDLHE